MNRESKNGQIAAPMPQKGTIVPMSGLHIGLDLLVTTVIAVLAEELMRPAVYGPAKLVTVGMNIGN